MFAIFKNGIELRPGDSLFLLTWYYGDLKVTRCPVFYCRRYSGRIMAAVSNGCSNGIKPERLRQFNQVTFEWFEMLTVEKFFDVDLRRFCRHFGRGSRGLLAVPQSSHWLWERREAKGLRYGFIH